MNERCHEVNVQIHRRAPELIENSIFATKTNEETCRFTVQNLIWLKKIGHCHLNMQVHLQSVVIVTGWGGACFATSAPGPVSAWNPKPFTTWGEVRGSLHRSHLWEIRPLGNPE